MDARPSRPPLVIGCGALARELVALTRRSGLPAVDLTCLPGSLHNRPERIPEAVRSRIRRARSEGYEQIFVAYADCGTGGLIDRVLEDEGVARLAGAHCYEVYAGSAAFAALHEEEPGTFYVTDFLVRNFEGLVIRGLGLDRHPELRPIYFGNYRRLVYLAQTDDPELSAAARAAADRLGLTFERRFTGLGELATSVRAFATSVRASATSASSSAAAAVAGRPAGYDSESRVEGDHSPGGPISSRRPAHQGRSMRRSHEQAPWRSSSHPDPTIRQEIMTASHDRPNGGRGRQGGT
ncbi:MAG TPA: DUF1638 domain-containing protein, partial [Candidatus Limnocylindrales bacterium]|nr:DUF1638 domain-containing protein [Candidatus Limnocylindrales bacterium]